MRKCWNLKLHNVENLKVMNPGIQHVCQIFLSQLYTFFFGNNITLRFYGKWDIVGANMQMMGIIMYMSKFDTWFLSSLRIII
jgi:hypothetical protein